MLHAALDARGFFQRDIRRRNRVPPYSLTRRVILHLRPHGLYLILAIHGAPPENLTPRRWLYDVCQLVGTTANTPQAINRIAGASAMKHPTPIEVRITIPDNHPKGGITNVRARADCGLYCTPQAPAAVAAHPAGQ
ncbi:hypothetical protein ACU4HD_15095 [Cupriavidus basilensis]